MDEIEERHDYYIQVNVRYDKSPWIHTVHVGPLSGEDVGRIYEEIEEAVSHYSMQIFGGLPFYGYAIGYESFKRQYM